MYQYLEQFVIDLRKDCSESAKLKKEQVNHKEKLLDIGELAAHFKKSKQTVHNWRKAGIITGKKMGKGRYFSVREVEETLNRYGINYRK